MIVLLLAPLALVQPAADPAAEAVANWQVAVDPVLSAPLAANATLAQRIAWLVARDEITRQHAWRAWDPRLTPEQQIVAGTEIGTRMTAVDRANTDPRVPRQGWRPRAGPPRTP